MVCGSALSSAGSSSTSRMCGAFISPGCTAGMGEIPGSTCRAVKPLRRGISTWSGVSRCQPAVSKVSCPGIQEPKTEISTLSPLCNSYPSSSKLFQSLLYINVPIVVLLSCLLVEHYESDPLVRHD